MSSTPERTRACQRSTLSCLNLTTCGSSPAPRGRCCNRRADRSRSARSELVSLALWNDLERVDGIDPEYRARTDAGVLREVTRPSYSPDPEPRIVRRIVRPGFPCGQIRDRQDVDGLLCCSRRSTTATSGACGQALARIGRLQRRPSSGRHRGRRACCSEHQDLCAEVVSASRSGRGDSMGVMAWPGAARAGRRSRRLRWRSCPVGSA
jgi:hypothetical protein